MATDIDGETVDELQDTLELLGPTGPQPVVNGFDTAALFLLNLGYENLFEALRNEDYPDDWFRCKGCGDRVHRGSRKQHHARHRAASARGDYKPKEGTKMATDAKSKKTAKPTAKDQGFPSAYLAPNGNFKPGLDARAKSDLIAAVLELDAPDSLHKFDKATAEKLIKIRSWEPFVEKKKAAIVNASARAEKAAANRAAKAKETAAKKTGTKAAGEARPDPKPKPRAKTAAGRKRTGTRLSRVK